MVTTNRKIRILCVEDDPQMRAFLLNQLRVRGHQVQAVQDGAQAIDQAAIFQPELILLDLTLPSLDGLAFLRFHRTRGETRIVREEEHPSLLNCLCEEFSFLLDHRLRIKVIRHHPRRAQMRRSRHQVGAE